MPTEQQLIDALRQADAAGDTYAANRFAELIKEGRSQAKQEPQPETSFFDKAAKLGQSIWSPQSQVQAEPQTPEIGDAKELNSLSWPAFRASLGLLTTGDPDSLKEILKTQFGDQVSFEEKGEETLVKLPSGEYVLNRDGLSGQDVAKFAFDTAAFLRAGLGKNVASTMVKSGAVQTAIDATEGAMGGDGVNVKETAIAAGIGGASKGLENVIGTPYRASSGTIDDSTQAAIDAAQGADLPILTSDVIEPEGFIKKNLQQTAEKIPFVGTGEIRAAQESSRRVAIDNVVDQYGDFSYSAIVDSLKAQKDKLKNAAGSVLQNVGDKLDSLGAVDPSNTKRTIQIVEDMLTQKGKIQSPEAVAAIDKIRTVLSEADQTFTSLKENRTALRELVESMGKAEQSQMGSRAQALMGRVVKSLSDDMDEIAKTNLTPKEYRSWKRANAVYAEQAKTLKKTKIKSVLDKGDITPESARQLLFSRNKSEVELLYKSLTNEGRRNARSAIIGEVVETLSKRANGITPNAFVTEMKRRNLPINVFFKGEEKRALNGLIKALDHTRRAGDAGVTTPTGQSLFALVGIGAAATEPTTAAALGGTLAAGSRLYESPFVRNALIKLNSLPAGSTQFEATLNEVVRALSAASQASVDQAQ